MQLLQTPIISIVPIEWIIFLPSRKLQALGIGLGKVLDHHEKISVTFTFLKKELLTESLYRRNIF